MHKRLPETLLQSLDKATLPKVKLIWQDSTLSLRSILAVLLAEMEKLNPVVQSLFGSSGSIDKLGKAITEQKKAIQEVHEASDIISNRPTYSSVIEGQAIDNINERNIRSWNKIRRTRS